MNYYEIHYIDFKHLFCDIDANEIIKQINAILSVNLTANNRLRENVEARAVFFHIMQKNTPLSLSKIGASAFKDHATVMHALKLCKDVKSVKDKIKLVESRLKFTSLP